MGCFKRTASKRILSRVKQITSPGWMHETSAGKKFLKEEEAEGCKVCDQLMDSEIIGWHFRS